MGWKGTVRSIGAAVRAAEREAKRKQRELERQQNQYEKMQELEQAAYEVEVYENYIDVIQSIHKECSPPIDWNKIASSKQPTEPQRSNDNESEARQSLKSYKPGFIDRLLKREKKKRLLLSQKIDEAINKDEVNYKSSVSKW
jgi:membrane-associated HD superfamily phosphohydrolase